MNPQDDEQKKLARQGRVGRNHPELIEEARIAGFESVDRAPERDCGGVRDQQQRNGKPERKLPQLTGRDAKVAPAIEGVEPEARVDEECRIEDETAGSGLPWLEQELPRGLKRLDGMNAEGVIDQMRRRIGK